MCPFGYGRAGVLGRLGKYLELTAVTTDANGYVSCKTEMTTWE